MPEPDEAPAVMREGPAEEIRTSVQRLPAVIDVGLPESPTTGYRWEPAAVPAGLREVGRSFDQPAAPTVGGGGIRTFRFEVTAPGRYPVEFRLARRWEAEALERRYVTVVVTVS
jgi:inhibitor of cysteine peptidase